MRWLKQLFSRKRRFDELSEEIREHIDEKTSEFIVGGMHPKEAEAAARREFGNVTLLEEDGREVWRWASIENVFIDIRYGLRTLRKSPSFTTIAILTLALGIGANTAIFSVVYAVLLRPLPFPSADRIVLVRELLPGFSPGAPFNPPDFRAFAERQQSFQSLAIYSNRRYELSSGGSPVQIEAARVSGTLFPLLGIEPMLGRTFTLEDEQPGRAVAVLSYGLWQRRYGADPNILERTILLNRQPYRVLGVMPRNFGFPLRGERWNGAPGELWLPLAFTHSELRGWGIEYNHTDLGRLKPEITLAQAQGDAARSLAEVEKLYPAEIVALNRGGHLSAQVLPYGQEIVGEVRTPLLVLLVAVGFILLIAWSAFAIRYATEA